MKRFSVYALLFTFILSMASIRCSTGANLLNAGSPLLSALNSVPNLSSFTSLLQTPGLSKLVGDAMKKPFTLLAPTNDALNSLGANAVKNLTNTDNLSQLANLVKDHIIPGKLDAAGLMQTGLKTAGGKLLNMGASKPGSLVAGDKFNIIPIDKVLGL